MSFSIGNKVIDNNSKTYVIAELSCNHNGSLTEAIKLIDAAAGAGADAVKLQTYKPDTISRNFGEKNAKISGTEWHGFSTYDLYGKACTPWEWYDKLAEHANSRNLDMFSSPFDETAVDFLVKHNCPILKVASFEVIDTKLLEKMAQTGLPIIMSNGMTTLAEMSKAYDTLRSNGCDNLAILHCNSGYPALFEDANLKSIPVIADIFSQPGGRITTGLSDHTLWLDPEEKTKPMGHIAPTEAVRFGARIIEVHLMMDREEGKALMRANKGGFDWAFSREPKELEHMINCIRKVENDPEWQYETKAERDAALLTHGNVWLSPTKKELATRDLRPSLYCTANVKTGDRLLFQGGNTNPGNFDSIRPNEGLPIEYTDIINGAIAVRDIEAGEPLSWDHIIEK